MTGRAAGNMEQSGRWTGKIQLASRIARHHSQVRTKSLRWGAGHSHMKVTGCRFMNSGQFTPTAIRQAFRFRVDELGYSIVPDKELPHKNRPYRLVIDYVENKSKYI